jgi:hypothetical protein
MTILHSGTSRDYADNWAKAFGAKKKKTAVPKTEAKPKRHAKPKKQAAMKKKAKK